MTSFDFILERGIFAVIRLDNLDVGLPLAQALAEGGVRGIEFTLTNRQALPLINQAQATVEGKAVVGMGTVASAASAREAIAAGARFLVTPMLATEVVEAASPAGVPVMMGAFTPTEVVTAWRAGAELIKVFPARLGGAVYLKDILEPLPQVRLVPSGGVELDTVASYIRAGAVGIAVGGALVDRDMLRRRAWEEVAAHARRFVDTVARARASA